MKRARVAKRSSVTLSGADAVNAAARDVIARGGGFGDNKAFIVEVWEIIGHPSDMTLDEFKAILWDMRRAGSVSLARADLVEAMPRRKVELSEFRPKMFAWSRDDDFGGETYHFVRVPAAGRRRSD